MRARVSPAVLVLSALMAAPLAAQSPAERIAGVRDGTVRLSFATRSLVCGNGEFIGFDLPDAFYAYTIWRDGYAINVNQDVRPACQTGPLRLVVVRAGGRVTELRAAVGVAWRPSATAMDLGMVSAPVAADWLVDLVEQAEHDDLAPTALLAAAAADSTRLTDRVLGIARNRRLSADTRVRAMRWAGVIGAAEGRTVDVDAAFRTVAADAAEAASVRERAIRELSGTAQNRAHLRSLYGQLRDIGLRERILREIASDGSDAEAAWLADIVLDDRERSELRERAVRSLDDAGVATRELATLYDRVTSRVVRSRLIRVLADRQDEVASAKLSAIATGDPDAALRREAERRRR